MTVMSNRFTIFEVIWFFCFLPCFSHSFGIFPQHYKDDQVADGQNSQRYDCCENEIGPNFVVLVVVLVSGPLTLTNFNGCIVVFILIRERYFSKLIACQVYFVDGHIIDQGSLTFKVI